MALETGRRNGDLVFLKWEDVDFSNKQVTFWDTKTCGRETVSLSDSLLKMLNKLKDNKMSEYVFPNKVGKRRSANNGIRCAFKKALKRAKLPNIRFHDLRHTFVSLCAKNNMTWEQIAYFTGHKSYKIKERYLHMYDHKAHELANNISSHLNLIE